MAGRWWKEFLYERLRDDPTFAIDYLNAAKKSGDPVIYESACEDVAMARAGILPRNIQTNSDTSPE